MNDDDDVNVVLLSVDDDLFKLLEKNYRENNDDSWRNDDFEVLNKRVRSMLGGANGLSLAHLNLKIK